MNYLDGFSGYGGFHLAFERAGWRFDKCYYSEIDKHAIANYSYNFPNSIYAGSIDTICQSGIITDLDLFTFGWPCQDNSIAGKRKGQQSGTRSGLLYEAVNIIDKFKPRNFVAENVAGLLSVNKGIDIIESFKILSYLNESMPQYDIEMQLLNTRWFLPQNRERLFFVGHIRGGGIPSKYFLSESKIEKIRNWNSNQNPLRSVLQREAPGKCIQACNYYD
jgi:DNA (cytosine-5)-methyltransferase 1